MVEQEFGTPSRALSALSISPSSHANAPAPDSTPVSPKLGSTAAPWIVSPIVANVNAALTMDMGNAPDDEPDDVYESSAKSRRGLSGQSIALDEHEQPTSSRLRRSPVPAASTEHRCIEPPHPRVAALRAAALDASAPDAPPPPTVAASTQRRPASQPSKGPAKLLASAGARSSHAGATTVTSTFREADFIAARTRSATGRKSTSPLGSSEVRMQH
jgi:hypothetical protein